MNTNTERFRCRKTDLSRRSLTLCDGSNPSPSTRSRGKPPGGEVQISIAAALVGKESIKLAVVPADLKPYILQVSERVSANMASARHVSADMIISKVTEPRSYAVPVTRVHRPCDPMEASQNNRGTKTCQTNRHGTTIQNRCVSADRFYENCFCTYPASTDPESR